MNILDLQFTLYEVVGTRRLRVYIVDRNDYTWLWNATDLALFVGNNKYTRKIKVSPAMLALLKIKYP